MGLNTLTLPVIHGLLALSLGLTWGIGGILCLGQTTFYGLGGYVYAIAVLNGVPPWAALVAAALGSALFRGGLNDITLSVATLATPLILYKVINASAHWRLGAARL